MMWSSLLLREVTTRLLMSSAIQQCLNLRQLLILLARQRPLRQSTAPPLARLLCHFPGLAQTQILMILRLVFLQDLLVQRDNREFRGLPD